MGFLITEVQPSEALLLGMPSPAAAGVRGFPHIPVMQAAPTGTPVVYAGFAPLVLTDGSGAGATSINVWSPAAGAWRSIEVSSGGADTLALANGTAAGPSLSFVNSAGTGLYRGGADILSISAAGSEIARLSASGLGGPAGAALTIQNGLTVTTGGATITAGGLTITAGVTSLPAGTVGAPTLFLGGDTTTGLYRSAANVLNVAVSGTEVMRVASTGLAGPGGNTPLVLTTSLSATSGIVITAPVGIGAVTALSITPSTIGVMTSEAIDVLVAAHTDTITGAITTQRFNRIAQATISAATAQTVTTAASFAIDGTPNPTGAGPATLTNAFGLMIGTAAATIPAYNASAATTIADAASIYIAGAPTTGGNVTVTRGYALWIAGGTLRIDGSTQAIAATAKVYALATTGSGANNPATAGQDSWLQCRDATGSFWIPIWR